MGLCAKRRNGKGEGILSYQPDGLIAVHDVDYSGYMYRDGVRGMAVMTWRHSHVDGAAGEHREQHNAETRHHHQQQPTPLRSIRRCSCFDCSDWQLHFAHHYVVVLRTTPTLYQHTSLSMHIFSDVYDIFSCWLNRFVITTLYVSGMWMSGL